MITLKSTKRFLPCFTFAILMGMELTNRFSLGLQLKLLLLIEYDPFKAYHHILIFVNKNEIFAFIQSYIKQLQLTIAYKLLKEA